MAKLIKNYIKQLIKKQVEEYGIVVWYDPDGCYGSMVSEINWTNIPLIKYEGSYYDVRFKVEQYFGSIDRHKILIYLNTKRDTSNFPLTELEKAGCIIEPYGPVERNTNLTVVVKEALSGKISEELIRDICEKIEDKTIVIDEIEKIVENAKSIDTAALSIIFNTNEPQSIILNFLANQSLDKSIQEKKLEKELSKLIHMYLGIEVKDSFSLEQLRNKTIETLLMVDFIESLKDGPVKEKYKGLNLPNKDNYISSIKGIVDLWRNRSDITEEYIRESEKVQKIYGVTSETFTTKDIINIQTFSVIDTMLIDTCLTEGDTKNLSELQEIIVKRRNAFWATKKAEYSLIWVIIEYCINLRLFIQKALVDVKQKDLSLSELMDLYISSNHEGWFLIDKNYRLLESKFAEFDIGSVFDDKLEKFVAKIRDEYSKFLNVQSECVSLSLSSSKMADTEKILKQKDILKRAVLPILQNKKRCAYFLVDAFRYEMGEELFESIENYEQKNILPALASIPTMTAFGMLSLLLYSNEAIDIKCVNGKVILEINNSKVNNRSERLKFIEEKMPYSIEIFKLAEVIKPKKSVRDKVKKADILIITSQEIDSLCESGESLLARQVMSQMILNLKRAIYHLLELGIEEFVISADHGYLLGNEMGKELKIESPNGETYGLHKRVWIGKGGNNPENTIRFKASDFGYKSELDFIFPRGIAVFKTTGSENDYFHGGLSLQEMVIPAISIQMKPSPKQKKISKEEFVINLAKESITNRIFTITVQYKAEELLFAEMSVDKRKVRINVVKDKEQIGQAVASEYGFDEATNEIILERNKKNVITIILNENVTEGNISILLIDSRTELELEKISDIPLRITI